MTLTFIVLFLFAMFAIELFGPGDGVLIKGEEEVQQRFRSFVPAMLVMFQIMTLDEWYEICIPLLEQSWLAWVFFIIYIPVSSLALMNLVTATIVEAVTRGCDQE